ncbi:MAG: formyltransferase family protein, partial [Dehalococcoidia bacterium]
MTLRLGWFTSARGPGSRAMYEAVAEAIAAGSIDARFAFVFCNREPGEDSVTDAFFERVRADGVPLVTLSSVRFRREAGGARSRPGEPLPAWRIAYDAAVEAALAASPFDLGVLAGYMLIFGADFVSRHALLNLHPALPDGPAGTWREVIRHLIRTGAAESGVMLHLAIPEVDMGPVVAYCRYALRGTDLDDEWARLGGGAA